MKRIYLLATLLVIYGSVFSQHSLPDILQQIETNNFSLKAAYQNSEVSKISAKTGIYPSNPSIDYDYLFGNHAANYGRESEMKVVQDFDFPTAYFQKNKISNLKINQADIEYYIQRQNVLLEAKLLCIELIYYHKVKNILSKRKDNATTLHTLYAKRLESGDATILETNKIGLELLNVQNEYRINEVEIHNRIERLTTLNGNIPLSFTDTVYPTYPLPTHLESFINDVLQKDPEILNLVKQKEIADKSVNLAKSLNLPKLSVGYRMNIANPEQFHGIHAGVSIPLWENRNTVKQAKAEAILTDLEINSSQQEKTNALMQYYNTAITLKESNEEYNRLLSTQNNGELLDKALRLGNISLLEYLTEINFLYQSIENHLQVERDYYLNLTELFKIEL